ncbi:MAG TPA: branched-chain amino acid ABC transporter permease, partial [Solirubrobacterales bacterium]|nr:branched-chain amino acid ABC transporter permease [Solirubrobacterales bacterium]
MTEVIQFALLGLGAGAVYALLAQGIVLIYRGSGVINLSHGALAMTAAYVAHFLDVESGWPLIPAAIGGIAVVTAIGMLTDQLVMRRLRNAPGLARLIATVGLLIVLQSLVVLIWGSTPVIVLPPFGTAHVEILGATASADRLVMLGAALALSAGLWLVWRFSRAGWITEAVSENQRVAAGLGWSPNLVSLSTWGVGSALAGLAGVLIAPITQLDPVVLPLTVIPALAAALIGGFRSFPLTLAGGLALGVGQAEVGNYVHVSGAADALPLAVILAVLVVGGSALPLRGQLIERLPSIGSGQISWRLVLP